MKMLCIFALMCLHMASAQSSARGVKVNLNKNPEILRPKIILNAHSLFYDIYSKHMPESIPCILSTDQVPKGFRRGFLL